MKLGIHLRRSEKCITRQHVNTQHSQSNLSPNESLLATINAPPSSPNSNLNVPIVEFDQAQGKEGRSNSDEVSVIKSQSNLIRKMVRSCTNLSLFSNLKLNLQSSSQLQMNLHQINSQPNFQSSTATTTITTQSTNQQLEESSKRINSSINPSNLIKQRSDCQLIANNNNNQIDNSIVVRIDKNENNNIKSDSEESLTTAAATKNSNKQVGRLRNVIEEKYGEDLDEEEAERMCMLVKDDEKQTIKNVNKIVKQYREGNDQQQQQQQSSELKNLNVNNKRKQFQKMSPFSTLDSSSSNGGLSRTAGRTALHSQDSCASLNARKRNWKFFKNRTHSTRTIHHSSSSRRAVIKMLGKCFFKTLIFFSFSI